MTGLWTTWAVFRFESDRTVTFARLAFSAVLVLFPICMVTTIQSLGGQLHHSIASYIALFILVPDLLCLMGLLLWATPVIHSELEGGTWSYLAVRPGGRAPILLGKYLAAVTWIALCALTSLTVCVAVIEPEAGSLRVWSVLAGLVVLSCLAYGALYVLMGVLFLRRAMVAAVAYTAILEVAAGFVPATINQFTLQYHLRGVGVRWVPELVEEIPNGPLLLSTAPAWQHILILLGFTAALLSAAILVLRRRELVTVDEG